jgi:hypothetical protein
MPVLKRAARPKFDNGAWSPAKISDVTRGGLYFFVTPDKSRPGNAAYKLWRMSYRFDSRQKTYSIGPYGRAQDNVDAVVCEFHPLTKESQQLL